jgi:hypothetical protein
LDADVLLAAIGQVRRAMLSCTSQDAGVVPGELSKEMNL